MRHVTVVMGIAAGVCLGPSAGLAEPTRTSSCDRGRCVDVYSQGGLVRQGTATWVEVSNRTTRAVQPFEFDVQHHCINGDTQRVRYVLPAPLAPGERVRFKNLSPVCVGAGGSAAALGETSPVRPRSALSRAVPGPVAAPLGFCALDDGRWCGSPASPSCGSGLPSGSLGNSCGSGGLGKLDGDPRGVLMALAVAGVVGLAALVVVGIVISVTVVATTTMIMGAVTGVALGSTVAGALKRTPLHPAVNAVLMDVPLGVGMLVPAILAIGTASLAVLALANTGTRVDPRLALAGVGVWAGALALFTLMSLGVGALGGAALVSLANLTMGDRVLPPAQAAPAVSAQPEAVDIQFLQAAAAG